MKVLCVLLALVALTCATTCGDLQRLKVKLQWTKAYGNSHERTEFSEALWQSFFNHDRAARSLFAGVNIADIKSPEFRAHMSRVTGAINRIISVLDLSPVAHADLAHLKEQHKTRGISASNYANFQTALMSVLPGRLGVCFDWQAWKACSSLFIAGISG